MGGRPDFWVTCATLVPLFALTLSSAFRGIGAVGKPRSKTRFVVAVVLLLTTLASMVSLWICLLALKDGDDAVKPSASTFVLITTMTLGVLTFGTLMVQLSWGKVWKDGD